MDFKEQVKKELLKLTEEEQISFAWRCVVRALPFFKTQSDFLRKQTNIQRYLFSVFHAIDYTAANLKLTTIVDDTTITEQATYFYYSTVNNSAIPAFLVAYYYATDNFADAADAANYAFETAIKAATSAAFSNYLKKIILDDINRITKGEKQTISIQEYGVTWDDFQIALKNEDCEYWAELYTNIFNNNFKVDSESLERRMNVPEEIKEQGAAVIGHYLKELEEGSKNLNEARIIILGDKGAGKTCVARKLKNPNAQMAMPSESTAGVDTTLWKLKEEKMNVRIWDFAGHTVTHAVHKFFLSERSLYIMVYDGRTEGRNRLKYWLDHMKNYGGNSQAFILVNERDQHAVNIPINALKEQYPIAGFYSFNVEKDKEELLAFRKVVANYIKNNPSWKNQEIPTSYYLVKEELEKLFDKKGKNKGKEHIEKKDFIAIAEKYDAANPERLLQDLHYLGISLWYKDMDEYETLVLNPEWISQGVYGIINWVNNEKVHSLSLDCFSKVFKGEEERFPKEKYEFLFNLMKHYELAYETDDDKKRLIIPHLLKEDQPADLPVFSISDSLMLKYEADQPLPPHTISRFIVRHNQQIKSQGEEFLVWRYGVILDDKKGSIAMVRERNRSIEVSVKGAEKTEFISKLRDTLNDIFNSYVSKKPRLKYEVSRFGEIPSSLPSKSDLWLTGDVIKNHVDLNRPFFDGRNTQEFPLDNAAANYNITNNYISIKDVDALLLGGQNNQVVKNTFNFKDCNLELQGSLNELAQRLQKQGETEEAEELIEAAKILEEIKDGATEEEIKKKGIHRRLGRIVKDLGDKDSTLYKVVEGVKKGKSIAQDFAKEYNKLAQWLALPQVPTPFLKKEEKEE